MKHALVGTEATARPRERPSPTVICVLVLVAFIYAGFCLIAKAAVSQPATEPMVFACYRSMGGAAVMLMGLRVVPRDPSEGPRDIAHGNMPRLVLLGALMASNVIGYIYALKSLPALTVSMFQPLLPVFAGIFAAILGVEDLSPLKLGSIVLAAFGAVVVIICEPEAQVSQAAPGLWPQVPVGPSSGVLFLLLNVSGGALYTVLQKEVLAANPPVLVAAFAQIVAGSIFFVGVTFTSSANDWGLGGNRVALFGVSCAMLTTAFNYSMCAWANKASTPTTVMSFMTLQPVFATLLSWMSIGVLPAPMQGLGGLFIIAGLLCFIQAMSPPRVPLAITKGIV